MINDIICLNFPLNKTNNALSLPQRLMVVNHNYAVRIAYIYYRSQPTTRFVHVVNR